MNVRELIEILHDLHGDTEVVVWDGSVDETYEIEVSHPTPVDGTGVLHLEI